MPPNLSWGDSRPYAVLQRTLDKDCRQAEEPKQLVDKASRFHLRRRASANSLRSFALALCYSAAENCTLVWSRSAHTSQVDVQLNSTVRLVSGTLRSTPLPWLPVLSNIKLPALRRKAATDKHDSWPIQSDILKPPLLPLSDPTIRQPGFDLPRQQWFLLNRFSTEQRHCGACRRKWRLTDTDLCPCGDTQTKSHIVESSHLTKLNGGLSRLHSVDEDAVSWLTNYG